MENYTKTFLQFPNFTRTGETSSKQEKNTQVEHENLRFSRASVWAVRGLDGFPHLYRIDGNQSERKELKTTGNTWEFTEQHPDGSEHKLYDSGLLPHCSLCQEHPKM